MAALKAGDRVQVVTRPVTSEDEKTQLYYEYFGGLIGTVERIYDDESVCVSIDLESLTDQMRERHLEMQENERKRWLDSLSDEMRNRLTAEQKQFKMNYNILVSKKDLQLYKGGDTKPKSTDKANAKDASNKETNKEAREASLSHVDAEQSASPQRKKEDSPKRLTSKDLASAEEEYLRSIQKGE